MEAYIGLIVYVIGSFVFSVFLGLFINVGRGE